MENISTCVDVIVILNRTDDRKEKRIKHKWQKGVMGKLFRQRILIENRLFEPQGPSFHINWALTFFFIIVLKNLFR
jgi:hypothetical protein